MTEEWKPVPDVPGYEASSLGRVRSLPRKSKGGKNVPGKILSLQTNRAGYKTVSMGEDHLTKSVHRIVAKAFHGMPPDGMEVCHNNGVKSDNRPENLRYGTRRENLLDRNAHGTGVVGEKNPMAKLTDYETQFIHFMKICGMKNVEISQHFNVSPSRIYQLTGKDNA